MPSVAIIDRSCVSIDPSALAVTPPNATIEVVPSGLLILPARVTDAYDTIATLLTARPEKSIVTGLSALTDITIVRSA